MSLNISGEDFDHLSKFQEQNGEEYEDTADEVEDCGKRKGKQTEESIQKKQKKRRLWKLRKMGMIFHHQSLEALIISLAKACLSPSLIWHQLKE